ncbi:MAG: TetR family transcriptional regulator C-terminal domain-containing protein [Jiangellaceae bacterium]
MTLVTAVPTKITWPPPGRPMTTADLDRMPDDGRRYELLYRVLIVTPAPPSTDAATRPNDRAIVGVMTKGALTRQAILRHGVQVAYRVGLGGLTIGALASGTSMSKSGLFAHFGSKGSLQLEVLALARADFVDTVIRPALAVARGEPRVRALFENWLACGRARMPGGCLFVKAATEFDEQSGQVRDQLARDHRDLQESIALIFRTGVTEGHFREDADPEQFASDLNGVMLAYYQANRLLDDPAAETRARNAFEALIAAAARSRPDQP